MVTPHQKKEFFGSLAVSSGDPYTDKYLNNRDMQASRWSLGLRPGQRTTIRSSL
jgi:hypothetical protein